MTHTDPTRVQCTCADRIMLAVTAQPVTLSVKFVIARQVGFHKCYILCVVTTL